MFCHFILLSKKSYLFESLRNFVETSEAKAHRYCLNNGSWHQVNDSLLGWITWSHKSACNPIDEDQFNDDSEEAMQDVSVGRFNYPYHYYAKLTACSES